MKSSSNIYLGFKIILILIAIFLFLYPDIFLSQEYGLAADGIVIVRGLALICALNIGSSLLDNIYNKNT